MTEEELKKKAKESYWNSDASGGLSSEKNYILGFIAGAKEMQEETLKEIIEIEKVSDYRWEENQQLKQENEQLKQENEQLKQENKQVKQQITEAKDLIRNLLRVTYGEGWNYSLDWKVKAEQFLKE